MQNLMRHFSYILRYFSHQFLKFPVLQDQKRKIVTQNILIEKILVYVVDIPLTTFPEDFGPFELKLVKI